MVSPLTSDTSRAEQVNRSRSGRDGLDSLLRLRAQVRERRRRPPLPVFAAAHARHPHRCTVQIMQDMDKQSQLCPPLRISRTNRVEMPPEASRLPEPVMSMPVHPVLFASESSANMKFHVGQVRWRAFQEGAARRCDADTLAGVPAGGVPRLWALPGRGGGSASHMSRCARVVEHGALRSPARAGLAVLT